jgi:hypothetical protein
LAERADVSSEADVDVGSVATTHNALALLAAPAARAGKHMVVEKPGARREAELDPVAESARSTGVLVEVGIAAIIRHSPKLVRFLDTGALGEPTFVRAQLGHGGQPSYENECRAVQEVPCGGRQSTKVFTSLTLPDGFRGDFVDAQGAALTFYWNMPVGTMPFFYVANGVRPHRLSLHERD